ncbi:hypothetical protein NLI96_g2482 [Meripilus lineatus]|uniref:Uncharacterized protein n=1 Tax=Meripilus lineatus TaxID=2056292 RepID=A0AAD5YLU7_9APHY|nr:hypothetical protein NLI96_g2482 [Physisporinus lineatus]
MHVTTRSSFTSGGNTFKNGGIFQVPIPGQLLFHPSGLRDDHSEEIDGAQQRAIVELRLGNYQAIGWELIAFEPRAVELVNLHEPYAVFLLGNTSGSLNLKNGASYRLTGSSSAGMGNHHIGLQPVDESTHPS